MRRCGARKCESPYCRVPPDWAFVAIKGLLACEVGGPTVCLDSFSFKVLRGECACVGWVWRSEFNRLNFGMRGAQGYPKSCFSRRLGCFLGVLVADPLLGGRGRCETCWLSCYVRVVLIYYAAVVRLSRKPFCVLGIAVVLPKAA